MIWVAVNLLIMFPFEYFNGIYMLAVVWYQGADVRSFAAVFMYICPELIFL